MRELNKLTEYIGDKKLVISHKRVESIEEIPKLKFINAVYLVENTSWNRNLIGNLQEFQYGKDVFQTTTNDRALSKRQQSFGYGNIE